MIEDMKITGEREGQPDVISGTRLRSVLDLMHQDSVNEQDFVSKVTYFVTDFTSSLSEEDQETLRDWYKRQKQK